MSLENNINDNAPNNMMISFFVEYPDKELDKIKLIGFKTKLYIAARSLNEFNALEKKIKNKNVIEAIYWPILSEKEGYWLSPFSEENALLRVISEAKNISVLWDAELPRMKSQIFTRMPKFFRNRNNITKLFEENGSRIYTAEYFPSSKFLETFSLSFEPSKFCNKQIKMVYSSMHNYSEKTVRRKIRDGIKEYGNNFMVGFGTLAIGVKGNEPLIKPEILERDLMIAKEYGVKEVVIYRLGGLNAEYLKIIKRYNKKE